MEEGLYVGAYWGPRKETALECARRAEHFFRLLVRCDPTFSQWYRGGRRPPRGTPGFPVIQEVEEWEQLFLRGVNRTDVGRKVIEELGFMVSVWNARKDRTCIQFNCGEYSPYGGPNSCLFEPPMAGPVIERLWRAPVLVEVIHCMVSAWDPDYTIASSTEMVELIEKRKKEVRVGWLTYLSRRLGRLPPLPAPVRIDPVGEQGWLLTLSPEPMSAHNPEHVAFIARVRELLDRAGLIAIPEPEPEAE